jgi:DNA replication protein DnaC
MITASETSLSEKPLARLIEPKEAAAEQEHIAGIIVRIRAEREAERQKRLSTFTGTCVYCFDTGTLFDTWKSAKPQPCGCEKAAEIEAERVREVERALLAKSGLTPRTLRFTMASYPDKKSAAYTDMLAYCEDFDCHKGLIMLGPVGIGKTGLAVSAGQRILHDQVRKHNERFSLRFTSYADLLDTLKAGFRDDSYSDILAMYKQCSLLILDDVGSRDKLEDDAHAALSNWQLEQLFDIANYRYEHLLPSIITSNLSPDDLRWRIGNRTVERWLDKDDGFYTMNMTGAPNLRKKGGAK